MRIETPLCLLRPWRLDDAESLVRCADNPRVAENLRDRFPHPYTADDAARWLTVADKYDPPRNFAIEVDGRAVGGIGIELKDDVYRRSAELGYWLSEDYWRRGIATAAVRAIVEYAFSHFDLCRLYASVFDGNPASVRVLEKAGFEFEGRLRQALTKGSRTRDELIYAVVRA